MIIEKIDSQEKINKKQTIILQGELIQLNNAKVS